MDHFGLRRLALKEKGGEIELERGGAPLAPEPVVSRESPREEKSHTAASTKQEGHLITSPMVGTFYTSPSPEDPSFVKIGDRVEEKKVVCIIEAMKVMNEVKAGMKGKVAEILVKNGSPVEYGTPLFRIIPE